MLTTGTLPATITRKGWSFAYLPSSDPTATADGKLVISEETGKVKKRTITTTYGIQFDAPKSGHRCFLVLKAGHAGNLDTKAGRDAAVRCGEVYEVVVNGGRSTCTCPGFALGGRECKHLIALRELVTAGDLPDPQLNGEADVSNTEREEPTPFGWCRRVDVTPARIEAAAAFLRALG